MFRLLSYSYFAQILLLVGLNFINPVHADYQSGPAFRFASKLESVPAVEFYDLLKIDEDVWLAGPGLYRIQNGELEAIFSGGRYTALTHDSKRDRIWFAGPEGVGHFGPDKTGDLKRIPMDAGYVWELIYRNGRVWFFGSLAYGWLYPEDGRVGLFIEQVFEPRPFTFPSPLNEDNFFVSSEKGLMSVTPKGPAELLSIDLFDGRLITWLEGREGEIVMGTGKSMYLWSGNVKDNPRVVESDYSEYFSKGINNGLSTGNQIAVTNYPFGVVFFNMERLHATAYSSESSGLRIGDVYKIEAGGEGELFALGLEGVGKIDLDSSHRFFPADEIWEDESIRLSLSTDDSGYILTERYWVEFDEHGYRTGEMPQPAYWGGLEPDGSPFYGSVTGYSRLTDSGWERTHLKFPVHDFIWGAKFGYAVTNDGLYLVDRDLGMTGIYPSDDPLSMLGELKDQLFIIKDDGTLLILTRNGAVWNVRTLNSGIHGEIVGSLVLDDSIVAATRDRIFRIGTDATVDFLPLTPGWRVQGLEQVDGAVYAALQNRQTGRDAIAVYTNAETHMLFVPSLKEIGELVAISGNRQYLAVVGKKGVGWFRKSELVPVDKPEVSFGLFLNDQRVNDRTIPNGMHFIDLQIDFSGPKIPSNVQYRINANEWRNINPQDPSLQFAGHGKFSVELRAVHPNGVSSEPKMIQFGIAPPWYLNPIYQGILLLLAVVSVWGIYALRHAQLKRTNLWLASEVKKQTRELEAATAARTNFLAGLSHDIRNPLNGVLMIAETLTRDPPRSGDDTRLKDLTEFGIIVDRMLGEILDFSAIDQTNMPMAFISVSLTDILNSSVMQNQFSIQKALVNMTVAIPPELKEIVIKTDRNWMIKILTNLIVNALEYSESERIEVGAVCHKLTKEWVEMEIYVKDWGKGIDDAEKAFVFDRFYRGESGIESGKHGTGLGLSICQEIAHAMGAHLILTDNNPSGSCFTLKGRFERVAGARELDREAVLKSLKGKLILVVDDLSYNRKSIVEFFKAIGCECDQSANGREALEMLGRKRYDIALLDWDLPGLMGPDIAKRHRKAHPEDKVMIIALTAYTDGEKKRQSKESGMNGYISKPLTASRLAYCLANVEESPSPEQRLGSDSIDKRELDEEIYKHIRECLSLGEQYAWEDLRRCAHRLTTLALMKNNPAMQQVCRDLQVSAKAGNIEEIHVGLAELRQWEGK